MLKVREIKIIFRFNNESNRTGIKERSIKKVLSANFIIQIANIIDKFRLFFAE